MRKTHKKRNHAKQTKKRRNKSTSKGGGKIILIELKDKHLMDEIMDKYGVLVPQKLGNSNFGGIQTIEEIVNKIVPKEKEKEKEKEKNTKIKTETSDSSNGVNNETPESPQSSDKETSPPPDAEAKLFNDITYKLYPFLLNVISYLEDLRVNSNGNTKEYTAEHRKHEIFALKTVRKIDLIKKPLWLDSILSYFRFVVGMGGNSFDEIQSMMYEDDLENKGKVGVRVDMEVYPDYSQDQIISSANCDIDSNKSRITKVYTRPYNEDNINTINHELNSMFFHNYIKAKRGKDTAEAALRPLTVQSDDILVSGMEATPPSTTPPSTTPPKI